MAHEEIAKAGGFLAQLKAASWASAAALLVAGFNKAMSVKGLRHEFEGKVNELKKSHAEEAEKNEDFREKMATDMGELKGMMKIIVGDRKEGQ